MNHNTGSWRWLYYVCLFEQCTIYRTHISSKAQPYNIDNPIRGDVLTPDLYFCGNCLSPSCTWFGLKKALLYAHTPWIKGLLPFALNTVMCACMHHSRQLHCPPAGYRWDRAEFRWQISGRIQDRGAAPLAVLSGWCTAGRNMSELSRLRWSWSPALSSVSPIRSGPLFLFEKSIYKFIC